MLMRMLCFGFLISLLGCNTDNSTLTGSPPAVEASASTDVENDTAIVAAIDNPSLIDIVTKDTAIIVPNLPSAPGDASIKPINTGPLDDSAMFKSLVNLGHAAKKIPSTAAINDLLMSPTRIEDLLKPKLPGRLSKLPVEIAYQMVLIDRLLAVDASAAMDSICNYSNLKGLDLRGYKLSDLPDCFAQFAQLEVLILDDNQFTELPPELQDLNNLKYLSINGNQLTEIPSNIGNLNQLQYLSFSYNKLVEISPAIKKLVRLQQLDVSFNPGLANNDVAFICGLPGLTSLNISGLGITEIPLCINALTNLSSLSIYQNDVYILPTSIGQLQNLESMSMGNSRGMDYDQAFKALAHCQRLQHLVLLSGGMHNLPPSIGLLSGLVSINLYDNQIRTIPAEIGNLSKLKSCNLSNNRLTEIPLVMLSLPAIEALHFANNDIEALPEHLNLGSLKRLTLSGNAISVEILDQLAKQWPNCIVN